MAILPGYPKWSPDHTMIAFHGDPDDRPDVLIVPVRGGQPRNITKGTPGGAYPSFSRDGQWIYFASTLGRGESRIWKMPATGGAPVQVTNSAGTIAIESFDGDLFYVDNVNGPGSVWRLPQGGLPAVKVVEGVVLGNFDVVEEGLYYIDRVSGEAGSFHRQPRRRDTAPVLRFRHVAIDDGGHEFGHDRTRPERDPGRPDDSLRACGLVDRRVGSRR